MSYRRKPEKKANKKTLGGHYMYAFSDYYKSPKHRTDWWTRFSTHEDAVKNFDGLALRVNWRNLEPKKDLYDFDFIEKSLEFAKKYNKKIILSLSWRTFWNKEEGLLLNAPDYVL